MENRECCNETGSFESKQVVFARGFEELNENDQQEILNQYRNDAQVEEYVQIIRGFLNITYMPEEQIQCIKFLKGVTILVFGYLAI